jgi:RNA polymerase sigma factor (sigma-70 family)
MAGSLFRLNTDERIVERIRRGDEAALVDLYHSSRRMIGALVERNSGSQDDADDILQESLVIVWERVRAGTFEPQAKLTTFLYGIAQNLWLRRLARMKRERPSDIDPDVAVSDDPSPLEELIESESVTMLRDALDRLGEPCRSVLLLYYYEECSMQEIAVRLGFANADTVKSKKYQCKKALEEMVKG